MHLSGACACVCVFISLCLCQQISFLCCNSCPSTYDGCLTLAMRVIRVPRRMMDANISDCVRQRVQRAFDVVFHACKLESSVVVGVAQQAGGMRSSPFFSYIFCHFLLVFTVLYVLRHRSGAGGGCSSLRPTDVDVSVVIYCTTIELVYIDPVPCAVRVGTVDTSGRSVDTSCNRTPRL